MSEIDENSLVVSFDSMSLGNEKRSYNHNSPSYGSQIKLEV